MRKPRELVGSNEYSAGCDAYYCADGKRHVEIHYMGGPGRALPITAKEARALAAWLVKAAEWMEAKR